MILMPAGHHLEKELRGNKMFGGMSVTTALNEADDAKVLRVIFSYKRIVSLDGWLEHMLVPYCVTDLVSVLVGDFRSNLDLGEIIKSRVTSLSETFAASVSPITVYLSVSVGSGGCLSNFLRTVFAALFTDSSVSCIIRSVVTVFIVNYHLCACK